MLVITKHPRGIKISDSSQSSALTSAFLRQKLRIEFHILPDKSFLLPEKDAYQVLRAFPPDTARWDEEILSIAQSQTQYIESQLKARVEVAQAINNANDNLKDYRKVDILDKHQVEAVAALQVPSLKGMAIFDEQGTGKTITALCGFDRLKELGRIDHLLIICPKSVIASWLNDIAFLFHDEYSFAVISGNKKERRQLIISNREIMIVTYEIAIKELSLLKLLLSNRSKNYLLVLDESFYIKNPNAARSEAVAEIRPYCKLGLILCGSPAPNSSFDIINQISIADGGVALSNLSIDTNEELSENDVQKLLGEFIYLRRLKNEVIPNIPGKNYEKIFVDLQPIQSNLYEHTLMDLVLEVRSIDDHEFIHNLSSFMARRSVLLQLCSHPGGIDPLYYEDPAKHLAIDKLIREIIEEQGNKVVIWSFFRYSLESIANRYRSYGLVRIDGTITSIEERIRAIRSFQEDPNILIFLGNPSAAGAGITLTSAHHAIYESFSNQTAHYLQSIDRIHRRGQSEDVTYHVILANNTIEEEEFTRLIQKERSSRHLLGDKYKEPMSRQRFLRELGENA